MPVLTAIAESEPDRGQELAIRLEEGAILVLPLTPRGIPASDLDFLRAQKQARGRFHKNIAYRPAADRVTGLARSTTIAERERLRRILAFYSEWSRALLEHLLPAYAGHGRTDYASFRPFEEEGRGLPRHLRNDLIHVDAFPTRPTHGDRILRVFSNIHPNRPREWCSAGTFESLAERYAVSSGILEAALKSSGPLHRLLARTGLTKQRSAYDTFMLRFHDFLKDCAEVQDPKNRERLSFPPGSTWMVYTDAVSHGVLSGQFALEQTVIVDRHAMQRPEKAPLSILERLAGASLA